MTLNDVWIAAHAIETGSVLATFDAHFEKIAGLRLWTFSGRKAGRGTAKHANHAN